MPSLGLTDRGIATLPHPQRGQRVYTDRSIPGFGIRVSQGGTKTFVLILGSERRKITIGRYPILSLSQARARAKTILARRQLGLDTPPSPFFSQIEDEYRRFRERTLRPGTLRKDDYNFSLFKPLARKRIAEIAPADIQRILDAIRAPSTSQEVHSRIVGLLRFAEKQGHIENWPFARLYIRKHLFARDRVLDSAELRQAFSTARLWRVTGHPFGVIVELLILTGQRRHQIGSLNRSYVDFEQETITWPGQLMKAGRQHTIPLGRSVRDILESRRVNGLFFPNRYGEPFSFSSTSLRLFQRDCGFDDWRLHDLRRTMATCWQEMGIDIATTEKMLSHSNVTGGLVGIYQRSSYLTQMREAVQKWETYLDILSSGPEGIDGHDGLGGNGSIHSSAA